LSVEDLVRVCVNLPPDASTVAAVSSALIYLDSRALAAFMKELAKSQQLVRAMELFDWLKALPVDHELYGLCDLYTFTTAISLMGMSQQLRKALELVGEMRARGLQCNVHTYSALMNVCIKVRCCLIRNSLLQHVLSLCCMLSVLMVLAMFPCSVMHAIWRWTCSIRCTRTRSSPTWSPTTHWWMSMARQANGTRQCACWLICANK